MARNLRGVVDSVVLRINFLLRLDRVASAAYHRRADAGFSLS